MSDTCAHGFLEGHCETCDSAVVEIDVPCPECDGHGWTTESGHAFDNSCVGIDPNGDCSNCPVQVQERCATCGGDGYV